MKTRQLLVSGIAFTAVNLASVWLWASPLGTAFTYQGRLNNGTNAANGSFDLKFSLFDAASSGAQFGTSLTNSAVAVTNGYIMVALDFGAVFDGTARWLEIGVRTNGAGAFTTLAPRQLLTPTPYALYGASAGSANTLSGVVPNSSLVGTYSQPITLNNAGNAFSGNGGGLTNVNANQLDGQHGAFYQNAGNQTAGTLPDARLSANVALRAGGNAFTGNQTLTSGSLGIGTTTPTRRLQATETAAGALTYPVKVSNEGDTASSAVGMLFQADAGGDRGKGALVYERTATWNRGSFHFLQHSGADSSIAGPSNAVVTIANSGDVGIGTTTPLDKLDVKGNMAINVSTNDGGAFRFRKGNALNWTIFTAPWLNDNDLRIRDETSSSDVMTFDKATGNVGIGTTSPLARLHVAGNAQIDGNLAYGGLGGLNWGQANAVYGPIITITNWGSETLQEYGVLKPADGFIVVMATVNARVTGQLLLSLYDITTVPVVLWTQVEVSAAETGAPFIWSPVKHTAHLTWVAPVSAGGYINLRLTGFCNPGEAEVSHVNMTTMFFPRRLN